MDSNPMFGGGVDTDFEWGLPLETINAGAKQRQEAKRLEQLEAEAVLLSELDGPSGEIVKRIVESIMRDLKYVLYASDIPDKQLVEMMRIVKANLFMVEESLQLTSLYDNSTKYVIMSFIMDILKVSLPQLMGYQAPFKPDRVASPSGIPTQEGEK